MDQLEKGGKGGKCEADENSTPHVVLWIPPTTKPPSDEEARRAWEDKFIPPFLFWCMMCGALGAGAIIIGIVYLWKYLGLTPNGSEGYNDAFGSF
jgi:hypothetical protein